MARNLGQCNNLEIGNKHKGGYYFYPCRALTRKFKASKLCNYGKSISFSTHPLIIEPE
jgi:hypothetical protein